ncbi:MAG TPA: response regulator transcription factor [Ktedonobacteraceae bacterium]
MKKPGASILVVDDEREILRALQRSLCAHGYQVVTATSGEAALTMLAQHRPDLVVLDLLLPGISGLEVCRHVRTISSLPIIVLSVRDTEQDKVRALDLGADDYVAKPFHMNEVLARIRVALRRLAQTTPGTESRFQAGPLSIDFAQRLVKLNGTPLALTPTEYDLLKVFVAHRGKLLTRSMLMHELWGNATQDRGHSLHVYVARVRQKIELMPERPRFILTIPGVGYRFQEADEEQSADVLV